MKQSNTSLTDIELRRYRRHLVLPEVGPEGQNRLKQARVLVVGAGGLGSPVALYLAAAGVGRIGLADGDAVDESNLQRQVMFTPADIGRNKAAVAARRVAALNPLIEVAAHEEFFQAANALTILPDYDAVVDCSDNFPTRYLVNDACVLSGKPDVFGAIHRFEGQAGVFALPGGPCYRCFFSDPPQPGLIRTCAEEGVLGVLPGIVGSIQAAETVKLILGAEHSLSGRLLLIDAWTMRFREIPVRRDPRCPLCGDDPTIRSLIDYEEFCGTRRAKKDAVRHLDAAALASLLDGPEPVQILEIREPHETALSTLPDSLVLSFDEALRRIGDFDSARPLVAVCTFGVRSEAFARLLAEKGYPGEVLNLQDGLMAWIRAREAASAGGTA